MPYKPSAANLRRARNKSRTSIHSNGTGGTGESLRSRADLFDHSGDEFEDAGMLPDEHIFALASETGEDSQTVHSTILALTVATCGASNGCGITGGESLSRAT